MKELRENDPVLFEELFKRYYTLLTAKAYEICGNWQLAEDAVQEFFADTWAKKSWQNINTNFASYAVKGVQYKTISAIRRSVKQTGYTDPEHIQTTDARLEAEQQEDQLQRELELVNALNELPAQRKEAFLLAHYHNKSYAEISEQMGLSVNTVKTHLRLAMSQLREILLSIIFFLIFS
ncbi:MAG TPA: sigma-70 family RNA polymerase sigma factor [Chitinophagaceae bacterium]|nr:sigma-70 family RNA polymerase sigma factor [Chitinophagaceae bacterium]